MEGVEGRVGVVVGGGVGRGRTVALLHAEVWDLFAAATSRDGEGGRMTRSRSSGSSIVVTHRSSRRMTTRHTNVLMSVENGVRDGTRRNIVVAVLVGFFFGRGGEREWGRRGRIRVVETDS